MNVAVAAYRMLDIEEPCSVALHDCRLSQQRNLDSVAWMPALLQVQHNGMKQIQF
jgi:hypothetical protein